MRLQYAKEKFNSAVESMATDTGNIKERLLNAYLIFHPLSENDFSEDLKEDWNFIYDRLHTEEPSRDGKGKVENTLKILDENTCVEIAERITWLRSKLNDKETL